VSDKPASATIATFASVDGGVGDNGGVATYGGAAAPTATIAGGTLTIAESATQGTAANYVGTVVYFAGNPAGTDCLDASTYTGVEFTLSGTVNANCTVQFSINDSEHEDATKNFDVKASGPAGAYSANLQLGATQITTTPTLIKVPFTGAGAPSGGNPLTPIDPNKLTGVQWQFTIPAGTATCTASLQISNLGFY
jgi:hypothetical protein